MQRARARPATSVVSAWFVRARLGKRSRRKVSRSRCLRLRGVSAAGRTAAGPCAHRQKRSRSTLRRVVQMATQHMPASAPTHLPRPIGTPRSEARDRLLASSTERWTLRRPVHLMLVRDIKPALSAEAPGGRHGPLPACPPRAPSAWTRGHTEALPRKRSSADLRKRAPADVSGCLWSDFQTGYADSIPVARSDRSRNHGVPGSSWTIKAALVHLRLPPRACGDADVPALLHAAADGCGAPVQTPPPRAANVRR